MTPISLTLNQWQNTFRICVLRHEKHEAEQLSTKHDKTPQKAISEAFITIYAKKISHSNDSIDFNLIGSREYAIVKDASAAAADHFPFFHSLSV